ncbi:MAG: hypothetical protein O3A97_06600 [Proteobacteria bacterium]|nr:hypothetical protein [Pseudomonadota bacterium]
MALTRKGVFKAARIGIFIPMITQAHITTLAAPSAQLSPLGLLLLSRL